MTPPKPRRYNGPVDWLATARQSTGEWPESTVARVEALFPYPPHRHVRMEDWLLLVARVAATRSDEPVATAERLALYVAAYAERYRDAPDPETLKETAL